MKSKNGLATFGAALAAIIASTGIPALTNFGMPFRATPSRRGKGRIDKSTLPHGYPGAKMARKAIQKAIAVKHPRGLRTNDIGFAQR